jgi:hypothetical protein
VGLLLIEVATQLSPSSSALAPASVACIDIISHSSLLSPSKSFADSAAALLPPLLSLTVSFSPQLPSLTGSVTLLISYLAAAADVSAHGSSFIARTFVPKVMHALQWASTSEQRAAAAGELLLVLRAVPSSSKVEELLPVFIDSSDLVFVFLGICGGGRPSFARENSRCFVVVLR